jgi:cell division protein FtsL
MLPKNIKNKKSDSLIFPVVLGIGLLAIVIFLVVSNWKISQKRTEMNETIQNLKNQIQTLETKQAKLTAQVAQSQSPDNLEKVAREDLNMQRPGEEVIVVKPASTTEPQVSQPAKNIWQKFLEKFHL